MEKLSTIAEIIEFLRVRKKWWLLPIIIFLIILGFFIAVAQGSSFAPFIYTVF